MVETAILIALVAAAAIVMFILVDKAGQPEPIPLVIKLVILLVALFAIANRLGYA
jgi:hypothetical protein